MPPNPKMVQISLQIDPSLNERVQKAADADDRSRNAEIVWLLKQGLLRRERMHELIDSDEGGLASKPAPRENAG